ncbi:MAG: alkaline phosphatase [Paenibacillus dendritiformis]|uniref:alkaline phosphatase n=1 Tax=Paenibacillus dendritiformis TaxID=130049 RepID=UPI00143DFABE|nr:alkaline phosphatase [Paenibacillus dendritiformis]MDU5142205.1 alkaline phosphatase [Paenibacillus dendritiformis]NKI23386.1 alkaline phosphatase [Paenibacillus dendritiformis]NRF97049.1 alkaline phosphatase [Paenibacillus dendritiformis]GIO74222.1 alkaline phosphatase [Paenibacillus dendritiformis]
MTRKLAAIVLATVLACFHVGFPANSADAASTKAKNIIFMVPDGFSPAYAASYRLYKGELSVMDRMLAGMVRTYSANSALTDSAAAATAMATGHKTNNGMIGTTPDGKQRRTILEAAREQGKSTGLVATSSITDATPAAFSSHIASREEESDIAPQQLGNADVLLGGGKTFFLPESMGGKQKSRNLVEEARRSGYTIVEDRTQLQAAKGSKLLGLFAGGDMAPELDREHTNEPSLKEMTAKAIDILRQNKAGFFLLVEGSQIDSAGHYNDAAWAMKDTQAFEEAVALAVDFAQKDGNTLVVVVGDHDTGGMSVGGYGQTDAKLQVLHHVKASGLYMADKLKSDRSNAAEVLKTYAGIDATAAEASKIKNAEDAVHAINGVISERALISWTTYLHTGVDVQIYAFGPGADLFRGLHNNTDLPLLVAQVLHIGFEP